MGSIRAARRDGTQAASIAVANNAATAAASVQGSRAETWNSMASSSRAANSDPMTPSAAPGHGPARGVPEHQPGDRAGCRAQRHAYADFRRALRYQERDDAIEANGRQQQAHGGEQAQQPGVEARPLGQLADALVEGFDVHGQSGIERRNLGAHPARHAPRDRSGPLRIAVAVRPSCSGECLRTT